MKKKFLLGLLTATLFMGLASCAGGNDVSSSSEVVDSSSEVVDSSSEAASPTIGDENWVYYAETLQCKLELDYQNRSFWTDGIEQVTLFKTIDGDTAHFNTSLGDNYLLKARFYGIDTPESTGDVQEYGKPASYYTKDILNQANENGTIVVSSAQSEYGTPNADSTGSRYVSLIWVSLDTKNAPYDELMLLNLMIVEYGYSWVKNVQDMPQYSDTFYAAETQAKNYKLMLHSGEPDPYYNYGDYEDVSLLELKEEVLNPTGTDGDGNPTGLSKYDNAKVRVQGTVAGFANHIIYLQDFCFYRDENGDPVDVDGNANPDYVMEEFVTGEYAGINIFAGMSTISSKFTTAGNYIQVCALGADTEDYGFQLTAGSFPMVAYDENDAQVLLYAKENTDEHALKTFEYTGAELDAALNSTDDKIRYRALNCRVKITDENGVMVSSAYKGNSGMYLYTDYAWGSYHTFSYKPYGSSSSTTWTTAEDFVGHYFTWEGPLAIHITTSGKERLDIYLPATTNLVLKDATTA